MTLKSTINVKVSQSRLKQALSQVPHNLESNDTGKAILVAMSNALLIKIKEAFIIKSRGGIDEAGDRWTPLNPKTIAYSRSPRSRVEKGRSSCPSQSLSKKQQERWWDLYRQGLAIHKGDKARAAKRAWFILKSEGAKTLFDKYAHGKPDILKNSGKLLSSIGIKGIITNSIEIHADPKICPYAAAHHNGVPGKLPQRRLWPPVKNWPQNWWDDILNSATKLVVEQLTRTAKDAR